MNRRLSVFFLFGSATLGPEHEHVSYKEATLFTFHSFPLTNEARAKRESGGNKMIVSLYCSLSRTISSRDRGKIGENPRVADSHYKSIRWKTWIPRNV